MAVYFVMIGICLIGCMLYLDARFKKQSLFLYSLLIVFIGFVIGMRSLNVGTDTETNAYIFGEICRRSLKELLFPRRLFNLEVGYIILAWLLSRFSTEPTILLLIVGMIDIGCVGYWIKKKTENPFLGLIIFVCVFLPFYLTGLRQSIAISIVLLFSLKLDERKYKHFVVGVILASLFHQSAIVALLYIPILFADKKSRYFIYMIVGLVVLFVSRIALFSRIVSLLSNTRYGDYLVLNQGAPVTYTLMLIVLGIIGLVFGRYNLGVKLNYEKNDYLRMITAIPIMAFVAVNGSLMRVAMYFSVFMVVWIPKLYVLISDRITKFTAVAVSLSALIMMFVHSVSNTSYIYEFVGWDSLIAVFSRW